VGCCRLLLVGLGGSLFKESLLTPCSGRCKHLKNLCLCSNVFGKRVVSDLCQAAIYMFATCLAEELHLILKVFALARCTTWIHLHCVASAFGLVMNPINVVAESISESLQLFRLSFAPLHKMDLKSSLGIEPRATTANNYEDAICPNFKANNIFDFDTFHPSDRRLRVEKTLCSNHC